MGTNVMFGKGIEKQQEPQLNTIKLFGTWVMLILCYLIVTNILVNRYGTFFCFQPSSSSFSEVTFTRGMFQLVC